MSSKAQFYAIDPDMAREMIRHNYINRPISWKRVHEYVSDMKNGNWQDNGEPILIKESGELINGQHRLMAIIKSGITVRMLVVTGIDDGVSIVDRNRPRSTSDTLIMSGMAREISSTFTVAIAKLHYSMFTSEIKSDSEIKKFIEDNSDALIKIIPLLPKKKSSGMNLRTSSFGLAALNALNHGYDYQKLKRFFEIAKTGIYDSKREVSAVVFRNDFLTGKMDLATESNRQRSELMCEKALYDFASGYERRLTYINSGGSIYSEGLYKSREIKK